MKGIILVVRKQGRPAVSDMNTNLLCGRAYYEQERT